MKYDVTVVRTTTEKVIFRRTADDMAAARAEALKDAKAHSFKEALRDVTYEITDAEES
jgi:hypothetical protein